MPNRIVVITEGHGVWAHDVEGNTVKSPYKLTVESPATETWHGGVPIASGVAGTPALIQGPFGSKGNFEVVVPAADGGLQHFFRVNDNPSMPWGGGTKFGEGEGKFTGAALIHSNFGNLEVVAVAGNRLLHFYRSFEGAVAAQPWDKHVLAMGNRIVVITEGHGVWAHDVEGNTVRSPYNLTVEGSAVAAHPWDKHVLAMANIGPSPLQLDGNRIQWVSILNPSDLEQAKVSLRPLAVVAALREASIQFFLDSTPLVLQQKGIVHLRVLV